MTITKNLMPLPKAQFFSLNGLPLSGGLVYTYLVDGTTPTTTYQDAAGTIANSNPIVLDSNGMCQIWGTGQMTFGVFDSVGNQIYTAVTQDPLTELNASSIGLNLISAASVSAALIALGETRGQTALAQYALLTSLTPYAPLANPALTGTPTAPTPAAGDNTTNIATSAFVVTALAAKKPVIYTANNTWTCPANITSITVRAAAGGGGGGYGPGFSGGGGGGGGGQCVIDTTYTVSPGTVYTITIGSGGTGGTSGSSATAGGPTSMGTLFSLTGGGAGVIGTTGTVAGGAAGGTGGTAGTSGTWGGGGGTSFGGNGGGSLFGSGGSGSLGGGVGYPGAGFGSGGGGGVGGTPGTGGNGTAGFVELWY